MKLVEQLLARPGATLVPVDDPLRGWWQMAALMDGGDEWLVRDGVGWTLHTQLPGSRPKFVHGIIGITLETFTMQVIRFTTARQAQLAWQSIIQGEGTK